MQETVVATGTNVKFIGSTTKMTQANWQDYFKEFKKTGIVGIDSFKVDTYGLAYPQIYDGAVMVNGILAKYETDNGFFYSTKPTQSEIDALFCARVYLQQAKIEIVRKTGLAAGTSYQNCADVIINLIMDEASYCTRNETYYDLAISYLNYIDDQQNVDCRRFSENVKASWERKYLRGNGSIYYTGNTFQINGIDPFNPPDDMHLTLIAANSGNYDTGEFALEYRIGNYSYGSLNTYVEPLVRSVLSLTYCYTSDFSYNGNVLTHSSSGLTAGEPVIFTVRRVDADTFKFAITVQGK